METFKKRLQYLYDHPVNSWHEHVAQGPDGKLNIPHAEHLLEACKNIGIDRAVCTIPSADLYCTPERFRGMNDAVYEAVRRYPGVIYGMSFVNSAFQREAVEEIRRGRLEQGMLGVKLYNQHFMDEPALYPLIEACIELDMPILMHAGKVTDPDTRQRQPRLSSGSHMAAAGRRYPEARFIMGHIGGGGDWQWQIKAIADVKNVYADMSGSVHDVPLMEESVAALGARRIFFATDGSFASCAGKILGADISDEDRRTILEGPDFLHYFERGRA